MELPSWKAVSCRKLALWLTLDSEKQPSRWATEHKSRHNSTIKPPIQNPPISFQDNNYCAKLALHVSALNFQQTRRTSSGKLSAETHTHTHTHDDYCMPLGSAHQGIMSKKVVLDNIILAFQHLRPTLLCPAFILVPQNSANNRPFAKFYTLQYFPLYGNLHPQ